MPHGFRSSFRDWAAECSDGPCEECELALKHVNSNRVEAAYRRTDLFERRWVLIEERSGFVGRSAESGEHRVERPVLPPTKFARAGQWGLKPLVGGMRVEGVAPSGCWSESMALDGAIPKIASHAICEIPGIR